MLSVQTQIKSSSQIDPNRRNFQAEDGIRDAQESRGLGDVYKRQQQNRVVLALQILPTCPLKNYVILVLKQSTGTSLSQCPLRTISVSSRTHVLYEYLLSVQTQINQVK